LGDIRRTKLEKDVSVHMINGASEVTQCFYGRKAQMEMVCTIAF
jgi:hypothetical protein